MKILQSLYSLARYTYSDIRLKVLVKKPPLKIVVGASGVYQKGWIPTDVEHVNLINEGSWRRYFVEDSIDAILAEHVWEHLTLEEGRLAAKNCFKFLRNRGYLRVAVPDGFHPSTEYIDAVKPGGSGSGSDDHKVLYDYKTFSDIFRKAGFNVEMLEWFDEKGNFNFNDWDKEAGLIRRSSRYDWRNRNGQLNYTSIILDAIKR